MNFIYLCKISIFLILFASSSTLAEDIKTKEHLKSALELWAPNSITVEESIATIITKENRVTETIYTAMVGGICFKTLTVPDAFIKIAEINFLNKHGYQGYVFEGGGKECKEYVKLPTKQAKIWILGRTHLK